MKFHASMKQIPPCGRGDHEGGWAVVLSDALLGTVLMESPTLTLERAAELKDALESSLISAAPGPLGREVERCRTANLRETLQKALAAYDALTPEQKLAHRREQAISWVYGEANMRAPEGKELLSRDEVARIVDRKIEDGSFTLRP